MQMLHFVRSARNWQRVTLAGLLAIIVVVLGVFIPQVLVPLLVVAVLLLIWERIRINQALRDLAARIAIGDLDTKLEVRDGAWGALCHAVNGLLQQQRRQQRLQSLLPTLPSQVVPTLVGTQLPRLGATRTVTVLVIGYSSHSSRSLTCDETRLAMLQSLAAVAQQQAELHGALLERYGDRLLLAFGAFDERPLAATLRSALQAARALHHNYHLEGEQSSAKLLLSLSMVSGTARAVTLPGLGYTLIGAPLDQALRLHYLAAACPEYTLLCSEEAYLLLRRLESAPWLPTDLRLIQPDRPAQAVYALHW